MSLYLSAWPLLSISDALRPHPRQDEPSFKHVSGDNKPFFNVFHSEMSFALEIFRLSPRRRSSRHRKSRRGPSVRSTPGTWLVVELLVARLLILAAKKRRALMSKPQTGPGDFLSAGSPVAIGR